MTTHVQAITTYSTLTIAIFALYGCGNKADLYLPQDATYDPISEHIATEKTQHTQITKNPPQQHTQQRASQ